MPMKGATPLILRFHLPATLKPKKPPVFVTLTPFRKKETPGTRPKSFNSNQTFF